MNKKDRNTTVDVEDVETQNPSEPEEYDYSDIDRYFDMLEGEWEKGLVDKA